MARHARGTVYAGIYHVTRRSAGPVEMFRDDFDRTDFSAISFSERSTGTPGRATRFA